MDKSTKPSRKATSAIRCTDKYAYFYQNTPLSNWWASVPNIPFDGHEFFSSEAIFMYLKAKGMGDMDVALKIVEADNDTTLTDKERFAKAKKLGKQCKWDEAVYLAKREEWMYAALLAKFDADKAFRDEVMSQRYSGLTFVEASPWDNVWGIKTRATNQLLERGEVMWRGLNLLGKLLTKLRDEKLAQGVPYVQSADGADAKVQPKPRRTVKRVSKTIYNTDGQMVYSILGAMIGDIAGSSREGYGSNTPTILKLLTSTSCITDDSVLTAAVADWINSCDSVTLAETLIKWSRRYPAAGYGGLYKAFVVSGEAQESVGNGGAMRVAPCAVVAKTLEEALTLAELQCKQTHLTDVAINGAKAVAASIFIAKDGRTKGKSAEDIKAEVKSYVEQNFGYDLGKSLEEIVANSLALAQQREEFRRTGVASPSYVNMSNAALSCQMAITAFLLGESYEQTIKLAIAMLGDSDTIACMAGSISSQVYGIPKQLVDEVMPYLPLEIVEAVNKLEGAAFKPSRVTPPSLRTWSATDEVIVYGSGPDKGENGASEVVMSRYNRFPREGYAIPTIGKSLEQIASAVAEFIAYARQNPDKRFHVRKVGYDKAGYSVEQIAPLFAAAEPLSNVLLPKQIVDALGW